MTFTFQSFEGERSFWAADAAPRGNLLVRRGDKYAILRIRNGLLGHARKSRPDTLVDPPFCPCSFASLHLAQTLTEKADQLYGQRGIAKQLILDLHSRQPSNGYLIRRNKCRGGDVITKQVRQQCEFSFVEGGGHYLTAETSLQMQNRMQIPAFQIRKAINAIAYVKERSTSTEAMNWTLLQLKGTRHSSRKFSTESAALRPGNGISLRTL